MKKLFLILALIVVADVATASDLVKVEAKSNNSSVAVLTVENIVEFVISKDSSQQTVNCRRGEGLEGATVTLSFPYGGGRGDRGTIPADLGRVDKVTLEITKGGELKISYR